MRGSGKKLTHEEPGKSCTRKKKNGAKQSTPVHMKNGNSESHSNRHKLKSKTHKSDSCLNTSKKKVINAMSKGKRNGAPSKKAISKATLNKTKSPKKLSSSNFQGVNGKTLVKSHKLKTRGKRKRQNDNLEPDETSRLQRRTRYLLIKMKLEQNLIDAYSMEGWKGQSREKIKPEKELQRARKQILKCKLGLRDAIRQLDLLSSVGSIEETAIAPDGSVYHEHILCAKCKLREAFPDNDIILCDGSCNCAFHQKCLDPPLLTENIPPGDQGWFCKYCDCKMEIIEAMNAHLGTHFSVDGNWQDIFKEEAALPDNGGDLLHPEQDWPSDDSEDDDYDPEKFENSGSYIRDGSEDDNGSDDSSSSSSLWSLEAEVFSDYGRSLKRSKCSEITSVELTNGVDSDDTTDCEILSGRRRRRAVDYRKLYDEMFGKDAPGNEQISEDEDWGPAKRKRREKESDAATTLMTLCESEKICPKVNSMELKKKLLSGQAKRPFFRIPANAVEKLRLVFAENELPARSVRENLSRQLGLEYDKVNKWFKNARYLALKERKAGPSKQSRSEIGEYKDVEHMASRDISSARMVPTPKNLKKIDRIKNHQPSVCSLKKRQHRRALHWSLAGRDKAGLEFGDDVSLKLLKENAKKEKKRVNFQSGVEVQEAENELERLCKIKGKVEKLQQVLLGLPNRKSNKPDGPTSTQQSVVYVPVAELKEKRLR